KDRGIHARLSESAGDDHRPKGNTWLMIDNRGEYYNQTILTVTEMKQEVTADASSLADAIASSGRVAGYGINFHTAKATNLAESEKGLTEISTLLNNDASLKLRIEGYTDNVGQAAANQLLSEQRAKAVVAWLTTHGMAAMRLTAKGLGASSPVADNSTEDGR